MLSMVWPSHWADSILQLSSSAITPQSLLYTFVSLYYIALHCIALHCIDTWIGIAAGKFPLATITSVTVGMHILLLVIKAHWTVGTIYLVIVLATQHKRLQNLPTNHLLNWDQFLLESKAPRLTNCQTPSVGASESSS